MITAKVSKSNLTIKERSDMENAYASAAKNAANIDYVAMMTDVEIPTGNEVSEHE